MVKVIMHTSIASAEWSYHPKQEVELPEDLAEAWQEAGHCTILRPPDEKLKRKQKE